MAVYPAVSQFEPRESAYECGFFTAALQAAAGAETPAHPAEWVDQTADTLYVKFDGPNSRTNTNGMSLEAWYACLKDLSVEYQPLATSEPAISSALGDGRAVCVTIDETSVFDLECGRVPYSWPPSGTHIVTITGIDQAEKAWKVVDTANIGPQGLRAWPRLYDMNRLVIHLATAIDFPWLEKAQEVTYTVQDGDTLGGIGNKLGVSVAHLMALNGPAIEAAAHDHGFSSSAGGHWIWPGEVLKVE